MITAWPTKLALVPQAARMVEALLPPLSASNRAAGGTLNLNELEGWPHPEVAFPPWEMAETWYRLEPEIQSSHAA